MADLPFPDRRRRGWSPVGAAALVPADHPPSLPLVPASDFLELFRRSRDDQRVLTLFVAGNAIAGVVLHAGDGWVELRNRLCERIVVRLDRVDAVCSL